MYEYLYEVGGSWSLEGGVCNFNVSPSLQILWQLEMHQGMTEIEETLLYFRKLNTMNAVY